MANAQYNNGIFFVNTSQKKAHLQRRCAFLQRNSPAASEIWQRPSEIASLWNICFANVKGEFHFTSNGVRYFTISQREIISHSALPNISLLSPRVLKNTENCDIIKLERRWEYEEKRVLVKFVLGSK